MPEIKSKQAWQEALADLITDPQELLEVLELDANLLTSARAAAALFPLKVTRSYVSRMQKSTLNDPLLKQVLPIGIELQEAAGYSTDPLAEAEANPVPGLLHKYASRVLVTLTSACAIHCRYCFRRHFPYAENNPGKKGWEKIIAYIQADANINEVILSGGDPLAVSDNMLQDFCERIAGIAHVKRLRIHTRLPVVLPERVTAGLLKALSQTRLKTIIVIHANHAQEIDASVQHALAALRQQHFTLLNQTVLLKGINDNVTSLMQLSEALFAGGVLPYYLHVLDKVAGAAHFDIALEQALALHKQLSANLSGFLVPKLVCEQPGKASKTLLSTALFTG